jgi:hypothetical protein
MMETYAERLKGKAMSNYDMDEIERNQRYTSEQMEKREKRSRGIVIQDTSTLEIDLDKGDALKLALQAHDKKVTLNQHIIDVLTDQLLVPFDTKEVLRNAPHGKPELLKEY